MRFAVLAAEDFGGVQVDVVGEPHGVSVSLPEPTGRETVAETPEALDVEFEVVNWVGGKRGRLCRGEGLFSERSVLSVLRRASEG
jgi:hypothetical protein